MKRRGRSQVKMIAGPRNQIYLRSTPPSGGAFALNEKCKNSSEIALLRLPKPVTIHTTP